MKFSSRIASAVAALALGTAGVVGFAGQSMAASVLSVPNVDQGQVVVVNIAADACKPTDSIAVDVLGRDGAKTTKTAKAGTSSVTFSGLAEDIYTATLNCVSYSGTSTVAGDTQFAVWPTWMDINPASWKAGDKVTLNAFGFAPGESVSLAMVDKSTGTTVWSASSVAKADEDGIFDYSLVLKADVPLGTYQLIATGDESGKERISEFIWGKADASAAPKPTATSRPAGPNPGLPNTGV